MSEQFEQPKWDVALESLLNEEFAKKGTPIGLEDLQRLAVLHAIRFDDILDTLLEMCIDGAWFYQDQQGNHQAITRDIYDKLFRVGRTKQEDLEPYTGGWSKSF